MAAAGAAVQWVEPEEEVRYVSSPEEERDTNSAYVATDKLNWQPQKARFVTEQVKRCCWTLSIFQFLISSLFTPARFVHQSMRPPQPPPYEINSPRMCREVYDRRVFVGHIRILIITIQTHLENPVFPQVIT